MTLFSLHIKMETSIILSMEELCMFNFFSSSSKKGRYPNPGRGGSYYQQGGGLFGRFMGSSMSGSSRPRYNQGYPQQPYNSQGQAAAPGFQQNPQAQSFCPSCGASVPAGSKFCLSCGAKIESAAFCPGCGKPVPAGAKFCPECGTPVKR